jgi:hypothetical protein
MATSKGLPMVAAATISRASRPSRHSCARPTSMAESYRPSGSMAESSAAPVPHGCHGRAGRARRELPFAGCHGRAGRAGMRHRDCPSALEDDQERRGAKPVTVPINQVDRHLNGDVI